MTDSATPPFDSARRMYPQTPLSEHDAEACPQFPHRPSASAHQVAAIPWRRTAVHFEYSRLDTEAHLQRDQAARLAAVSSTGANANTSFRGKRLR